MKIEKAAVKTVVKPAAKPIVKAIASKPATKKVMTKKPVSTAPAMKPTVKPAAPAASNAAPKVANKVAAKPAVKSTPTQKRIALKRVTKSTVQAVSPIVRDSFTMTTADQELLKNCKRNAVTSGRDSTKKSEIVRAALRHFASLAASTQLMELNSLDPVKTGRPKKK